MDPCRAGAMIRRLCVTAALFVVRAPLVHGQPPLTSVLTDAARPAPIARVAYASSWRAATGQPLHVDVGDRVRFRRAGANQMTYGELTAITEDSIRFKTECTQCPAEAVDRTDVTNLQVSGGKVPSGWRTLGGAAAGLSVAVAATAIGGGSELFVLIALGPTFGIVGGYVGGVIGFHWKAEQWMSAVLPGQ